MTAGAVFQRTLRWIRALQVTGVAERDLLAALEAPRPGPLQLLYEVGHECGLARDRLLSRAAGLYLLFSAGNLADDLIDGECSYLGDPWGRGPSIQFTLQHAGVALLCASGLAAATLQAAAVDLARGGAAEHEERRPWTFDRYRRVAEGIAGRQWMAYLRVLWCGGGRAERAEPMGYSLGIALHISEDIRTSDPRYTELGDRERGALRAWGDALTAELEATEGRVLPRVGRALREQIAEAGG